MGGGWVLSGQSARNRAIYYSLLGMGHEALQDYKTAITLDLSDTSDYLNRAPI